MTSSVLRLLVFVFILVSQQSFAAFDPLRQLPNEYIQYKGSDKGHSDSVSLQLEFIEETESEYLLNIRSGNYEHAKPDEFSSMLQNAFLTLADREEIPPELLEGNGMYNIYFGKEENTVRMNGFKYIEPIVPELLNLIDSLFVETEAQEFIQEIGVDNDTLRKNLEGVFSVLMRDMMAKILNEEGLATMQAKLLRLIPLLWQCEDLEVGETVPLTLPVNLGLIPELVVGEVHGTIERREDSMGNSLLVCDLEMKNDSRLGMIKAFMPAIIDVMAEKEGYTEFEKKLIEQRMMSQMSSTDLWTITIESDKDSGRLRSITVDSEYSGVPATKGEVVYTKYVLEATD